MEKSANIRPRLLALNGQTDAQPIYLTLSDGVSFIFGRSAEADLPLKDIGVSRRHCRIFSTDEEFNLEDFDSHNGTFVNDEPIKKRLLRHGDRIRVGSSDFRFLLDESSDSSLIDAQFDDGTLITNSMVRIFPLAALTDFPADLGILVKLGKAINELREPEILQRKILEIILEFIPARHAAILITDENYNEKYLTGVLAKGDADDTPMQISRTVTQQVLLEQVALLSNDLSDKNLSDSASLMAARVSALLCVPLKIGSFHGLIYLDASAPDMRFTENQLEQLTAISFLVSAALQNADSMATLRQENAILKDNLHNETNMIGESLPMKEVLSLISRVASSDSNVLITGESGTGKELVAQALHRHSARRDKLFVAINCAVLNDNLLESELFGYEKGAFTGATERKLGKFDIADGGTIFFDEIGELASGLQAKLLRVLQEREFERVGGNRPIKTDVRVLAATNRNLDQEAKNGSFRRDLFFRLNVVQIKVPPLRERKSDIPLLARHFVKKYSQRCNRKVTGITKEAREILQAGEWHGNIRELENVIERALVLGASGEITPEDLPPEIIENAAETAFVGTGDYNEQLKQAKQQIIRSAIEKSGGNFSEAARQLNIHPNNLHRLIRDTGVKDELKLLIKDLKSDA